MQIEINGSLVEYEEHGKGMPVLVLHGHGVDRRLMTGCCEPVFEKTSGYRRIYPDLPGMGKSVAAQALQSADDMLDVVQAFARRVVDGPYLLVGESHGGYLALGLLQRGEANVAGVFLLCPAVIADHRKRTLPKAEVVLRREVPLGTTRRRRLWGMKRWRPW